MGIIGPGRAGLGLALALRRAGVRVLGVHGRRHKPMPRGIALSVGGLPPWLAEAGVVLVAVRDEALAPVVVELAEPGLLHSGQAVLHLSGARSSEVLAPLRHCGAAVGSMHPLMTVSEDPKRAAKHFAGATFALEGDVAAVSAADAIARRLGGRPVMIAPELKPAYHAGAVFASNYVVVLLAAAERLLAEAGIPPEAARAALLPLARATLDNVAAVGVEQALTGPVARGDTETVTRHLGVVAPELRPVYVELARLALDLARAAGLSEERARALLVALGHPAAAPGAAGQALASVPRR